MPIQSAARWYHCTTHTYGAWLPGDPRGFGTRHHREHIEGDYNNPPPPGKYAARHAYAERLLVPPPVVLPADLRPEVGGLTVGKLLYHGAEVLALRVSGRHVHLPAKMPPGPIPRLWVGSAKRQVTFALKARGWDGELWAVRSKINPVKDRDHQLNSFHYILRHAGQGAWVWDFRSAPR